MWWYDLSVQKGTHLPHPHPYLKKRETGNVSLKWNFRKPQTTLLDGRAWNLLWMKPVCVGGGGEDLADKLVVLQRKRSWQRPVQDNHVWHSWWWQLTGQISTDSERLHHRGGGWYTKSPHWQRLSKKSRLQKKRQPLNSSQCVHTCTHLLVSYPTLLLKTDVNIKMTSLCCRVSESVCLCFKRVRVCVR